MNTTAAESVIVALLREKMLSFMARPDEYGCPPVWTSHLGLAGLLMIAQDREEVPGGEDGHETGGSVCRRLD